jgi:5-methylthioadenosine/S-adenosylhomocysteine deaminase
MEQADLLLCGGAVVTMDTAYHIYSPGAVAVRGRDIVAVGPLEDVQSRFQAAETLDCRDQVIIPGLINTHTHMPMSLLRGLADDLRLDVWLYGYILPVEKQFVNPEFCYLGTLLSCAEMIRSGTTCYADMYYFEEEIAWATVEAGMRAVCGETVMKFPTPDAPSYDESLNYCREFLEHWRGHELIIAAPAPHSVYLCTPEILQATTEMARAYNVPLLIHVSETAEEVEEWVNRTSMPPLRWMETQGMLEAGVLAAHCVHLTHEELHILKTHQVGVAHNPTSNLKLASGFAPIEEMLQLGVNVGLGTDGCASNNNLDMFEEVNLAALVSKAVTHNPVAVPARQALAMATIQGAKSLRLDHLIGSIEVGKRADLAILDATRLHTVPHFETTGQNLYSQLVYASKSGDVRHVLINGRLVMRDRQLLTVKEESVIAQARQLGEDINVFFVKREKSLLEKVAAIGGLEREESYEVQVKARVPDRESLEARLKHPDIALVKESVREQYDTYFTFGDPNWGMLRYREDNVIADHETLAPLYTLTVMGPTKEHEYGDAIVLSRSRLTAPADRTLRFYREYFRPTEERQINKKRFRYRIRYRGVDFAVNLDQIAQPAREGWFLEIKSRTWSSRDAERKAALIGELLQILTVQPEHLIRQDYVDWAKQ